MQQGERAWLILSSEWYLYVYVCWQKRKRSSKTKIMLMHSLSWPANTNTFTNLQNSSAWTDTARKGPWAHLFSWSCIHDCANNFKLWLHSSNSCDLTVWLLHALTSTRQETADLLHKSSNKSNWLCYHHMGWEFVLKR